MFMSVTSPTKAWTIYQEPRPWRKLSLHPLAAINYKEHFSQGWGFMNPSIVLAGIFTCSNLYQSSTGSHSCWKLMNAAAPAMSRRYRFMAALPILWLLQSFCPLFCDVPEYWGKKVNTDVPFRTQCCTVIYFLHSDQLWLSSPFLTSF